MPLESPQAIVRNGFKQLRARGPQLVAVTGASQEIYNRATEPQLKKLYIHNVGTTAVKYAQNQNVVAGSYHDVIAGGSVAEDGLGSGIWFDFRDVSVDTITVIADSGAGNLALTKYVEQF